MLSKKTLIIKAVYSALLPVAFYLAAYMINISFPFSVIIIIAAGVLFLAPFTVNTYYIKNNPDEKIAPYIGYDALCVTAPAMLSSLICEIILYVAKISEETSGLFCIILCIMFPLLSVFQWLMYPLKRKLAKISRP